ncbi:hypothetical protein HAX54_045355 [Datura stramonium]|uniref:Uncharacterized protein n=1 Tax=Datura stramonium TaxID=4076 RepID=A0ABS8WJB8_DATST|nr:hypothetical protein [Datura stramonium]
MSQINPSTQRNSFLWMIFGLGSVSLMSIPETWRSPVATELISLLQCLATIPRTVVEVPGRKYVIEQ